jgi:hypothetical protein
LTDTVQADNNLIENTIRPTAIGKKNWLFMGAAETGARAATFYTLIGNCHREGIDAFAYLTDVFTRLPSETNKTVHRLTPKAWLPNGPPCSKPCSRQQRCPCRPPPQVKRHATGLGIPDTPPPLRIPAERPSCRVLMTVSGVPSPV